jgi:hypothetical protein
VAPGNAGSHERTLPGSELHHLPGFSPDEQADKAHLSIACSWCCSVALLWAASPPPRALGPARPRSIEQRGAKVVRGSHFGGEQLDRLRRLAGGARQKSGRARPSARRDHMRGGDATRGRTALRHIVDENLRSLSPWHRPRWRAGPDYPSTAAPKLRAQPFRERAARGFAASPTAR